MPDETRQIRRVSSLLAGLGLFSLVSFFLQPAPAFAYEKIMVWAILMAGIFAGLGAMLCVAYLKRKSLEIPFISLAAAAIGGVSLCGSVFIIANILYFTAVCSSFPFGC